MQSFCESLVIICINCFSPKMLTICIWQTDEYNLMIHAAKMFRKLLTFPRASYKIEIKYCEDNI